MSVTVAPAPSRSPTSAQVNNYSSFIGNDLTATGVVNVDGDGSTWNAAAIAVGLYGAGKLSITNGGTVIVSNSTGVGVYGSAGTIDFGSGGGTLTTKSLLAVPSQFTGAGRLIAHGWVTDTNLTFSSAADLIRSYTWGQDIAVTIDMASNPSANGSLGVGYLGTGTLLIQGIAVQSDLGYLGFNVGSAGVANVTGANSFWNIASGSAAGNLFCGYSGSGTLAVTGGGSVTCGITNLGVNAGSSGVVNVAGSGSTMTTTSLTVGSSGNGYVSITNGGRVTSSSGILGAAAGSTGVAHLDGAGSSWTTTGATRIGMLGGGTLSVTGGTAVSVGTTAYLVNGSVLAIDVGRGSSFTAGGTGTSFTNNGTVRILAGAGVPVGQFNLLAHLRRHLERHRHVSGPRRNLGRDQPPVHRLQRHLGTSGSPVSSEPGVRSTRVDRRCRPRGNPLGRRREFPRGGRPNEHHLHRHGHRRHNPRRLRAVLSGWMFSTTGYDVSPSNPIYLSFNVGDDYPLDNLHIWHYDGTDWTSYDADRFDLRRHVRQLHRDRPERLRRDRPSQARSPSSP